jgi:hypothetical protein
MMLTLVALGVPTADAQNATQLHGRSRSTHRFTRHIAGEHPASAAARQKPATRCNPMSARRSGTRGDASRSAGIHPKNCAAPPQHPRGSSAARHGAAIPPPLSPAPTAAAPCTGRPPLPWRSAASQRRRDGAAGARAGIGRSATFHAAMCRPRRGPVPSGAGRTARGAAGSVFPRRPRGGEVDRQPRSDRALLACPTFSRPRITPARAAVLVRAAISGRKSPRKAMP